jgi:hypothetical protein
MLSAFVLFVTLQTGPSVTLSPSVVEGPGRTSVNVDKFLEAKKPAVLACAEKHLKKKGSLALRFFVLPTGRLADIEVLRSFNADVAACLTKNMNSWAFPPAEAAARVAVEFTLKP